MAVFTSQVNAYEKKVNGTKKDSSTSITGDQQGKKEGLIMVVINLRDAPKSIKEMRRGSNHLHYEIVKFPLTECF
jgi:hypothetical protein